MIKRVTLFLIISSLILGSFAFVSAMDDMIQIAQWARSAEASSQYGDDDWSADQATGRPDVEECADSVEAWASEEYDDGEESLTVFFRDEVHPTQINIYQNLSPGAIIAIEILPEDDDDDPIHFDIEDPSDECPSVLSIDLPEGLPLSNGVTIYLDQDIVGYWNEIDAVELVGMVEGDEDDEEESSLEENDYPEYEVFSVDAEDGSSRNNNSNDNDDRDDDEDDDDRDNDSADYDVDWGRNVSCDGGGGIENGVELTIVQQRSGNTYRVTAIGIDGFDPVLAVTLSGNYNNALCNDDDSEASTYSADLPTTGDVDTQGTSSQVVFNLNSASAFENVSIIVGGFGESSGEFLLIIEGMYASSADGAGDPMSLSLSPALIESNIDPTAYMISVVSRFDPLIYLADNNLDPLADEDGVGISCDDAGSICWGDSSNLNNSYVSRSGNRQLGGGQYDSMITLPISPEFAGLAFNYVMTSYGDTEGDYVVAFHLGVEAED